jgi:hypothetical protein
LNGELECVFVGDVGSLDCAIDRPGAQHDHPIGYGE